MTDNQKLQLWQAGILGNPDELQVPYNTPDYLNNDAAAMSLLDTLVEKGFVVELCSNDSTWACEIIGYVREYKPTRREAGVAAVLELIGKEDV